MRVLGVDPGISGAVALYDTTEGTIIAHDMPLLRVRKSGGRGYVSEINEPALVMLVSELRPAVAWVERVHSMPRQGVASTFTFALAYGVVRGVLAAARVPTLYVAPEDWKRTFRLRRDKAQSRALAARLWPQHTVLFSRARDDGRAEAALIARWGAAHPLSA